MLPRQPMVTIKNPCHTWERGIHAASMLARVKVTMTLGLGHRPPGNFSTVKRYKCRAPMLCALGLVLLAGCMPAGPRALLEGKRLIEQRHYLEAVTALKTATSLLTTNAQAWNYLGLACHYSGQAAEAEKAYQRALLIDHDLFEARYNLGCLLLEQNKTNAARNELMAFTLRRPNSIDGLIKLGLAQLRCREWAAAEKSFAEVSRLSPTNAAALNGLGLVRLARNRAGEAAQLFHRALKENPGFSPALLNLAIVSQQHLKNHSFALQKYREYLALKPAPPNSEAVKSVVQQLERQLSAPPRLAPTNAATATLTNKVAASNPPAPPLSLASKAASIKSEPVKTAPVTNTAVYAPASPPPPVENVELVKIPEEPIVQPAQDVPESSLPTQKAAADAGAAGETNPPTTIIPDTATTPKRGFFQKVNPLNVFRAGEKPNPRPTPLPAAKTQLAANELAPADNAGTSAPPRYVYHRPSLPRSGNRAEAERAFAAGVQAQQAEKWTAATSAYENAIKLDPGYFEAHYNAALTWAAMGKLPEALAAYEQALAIRPHSTDARYNFALVLKQANYLLDAMKELETLLASSPNEARAHLELGNIYAQRPEPAKARYHYAKVLESDSRHPQAGAIRYWLAANPQ